MNRSCADQRRTHISLCSGQQAYNVAMCCDSCSSSKLIRTCGVACVLPQDARNRGITRLVLLTTRTADWFMQRDFKLAGPAWSSELLPPTRRKQVNPARNSQLYYKDLDPLSDEERQEPGTRIGF